MTVYIIHKEERENIYGPQNIHPRIHKISVQDYWTSGIRIMSLMWMLAAIGEYDELLPDRFPPLFSAYKSPRAK